MVSPQAPRLPSLSASPSPSLFLSLAQLFSLVSFPTVCHPLLCVDLYYQLVTTRQIADGGNIYIVEEIMENETKRIE